MARFLEAATQLEQQIRQAQRSRPASLQEVTLLQASSSLLGPLSPWCTPQREAQLTAELAAKVRLCSLTAQCIESNPSRL